MSEAFMHDAWVDIHLHRNENPDSITYAIVPAELGRLTNAVRQRRGG